jgi:uncharacterized protein YybS (DUF2232 family)
MSILHRLLRMLVLALLLLLGLAIVLLPLSHELWEQVERVLRVSRVVTLWAGTAVLLLAVAFAVTGFQRRRRERFLSFDGESGTVSISTEAICDYLSKLAPEFPAVKRLEPKVIPVRRSIDIVVYVRVRAGAQIHEMCELLQKRVREAMSSGLGITEIRRVEVSVREIVSEHMPSKNR